ncbi:glutamate--tRNA ligase [Chitinispirillales bacterium ANBcel5]|uniref:glutamate--tRNA ligase n=1 Tax=Cellulosispirillum alkaliphilum TaxID=3039283 RepID=UPI002A579279|nr:glutamate--tRNA ligase [Chitinispirillales bacterium ANBcel5]
MENTVRVRFAPSPTGYLHVGGARSALFNFLFARHHGGTFILRIEDTDRSRFVEGALDEIYESLTWLGLQWDEGPEKGGDYGPYTQSKRNHLYQKYANQLLENGHAYRCFCSSERLASVREQQEKSGNLTGYDRHCRNLSNEQIQQNLSENIPFIIRFKIPQGRIVKFKDLIRGEIEYNSDVLDDLVLIKSDGFPTYHMANVIDDHLMKISHVLRGDEWIASTPRHVLIYEAFGWQLPQFAHLPVILSPTGGKLSKRKGAASVMDYKKGGYLPEALFNFLALLGWAPGDDREKISVDELVKAFSLEQVSPKASVFDEKKLEWMNGLYMAERSSESLSPAVLELLKERGVVGKDIRADDKYLLRAIDLLKGRSKRIIDLADNSVYFFIDPSSYEKKAEKKHYKTDTLDHLRALVEKLQDIDPFSTDQLECAVRDLAQSREISTGKLIHPTRLAVSGVSFGPGLYELLSSLGKETVIRRIEKACEYLENK